MMNAQILLQAPTCNKLYAIQYRKTLYGVHAPRPEQPHVSETRIMTFTTKEHAAREADLLAHNRCQKTGMWPCRVLEDINRPEGLVVPLKKGCHLYEPGLKVVTLQRKKFIRQCGLNGLSLRVVDMNAKRLFDLRAESGVMKVSAKEQCQQLERLYKRKS